MNYWEELDNWVVSLSDEERAEEITRAEAEKRAGDAVSPFHVSPYQNVRASKRELERRRAAMLAGFRAQDRLWALRDVNAARARITERAAADVAALESRIRFLMSGPALGKSGRIKPSYRRALLAEIAAAGPSARWLEELLD